MTIFTNASWSKYNSLNFIPIVGFGLDERRTKGFYKPSVVVGGNLFRSLWNQIKQMPSLLLKSIPNAIQGYQTAGLPGALSAVGQSLLSNLAQKQPAVGQIFDKIKTVSPQIKDIVKSSLNLGESGAGLKKRVRRSKKEIVNQSTLNTQGAYVTAPPISAPESDNLMMVPIKKTRRRNNIVSNTKLDTEGSYVQASPDVRAGIETMATASMPRKKVSRKKGGRPPNINI